MMTFSFLLRFQEKLDDSCEVAVATGTETKTKVMHEQPDADPARADFHSLPGFQYGAGTITNTRIRSEQGDADYRSTARTFPVQSMSGTMTKTAVQMEMDDQDPRQHELTVIPKCFSS